MPLVDEVRALLADETYTEKRMFGSDAFLVGGHLAVAARGRGGLLVRVHPDETDALLAEPGAHPFEMNGRPPRGGLHVDADDLAPWVARGVAYAKSLPPK